MKVLRSLFAVSFLAIALVPMLGAQQASAVYWSVSIKATSNQVQVGQTISVTATANGSLSNTNYELRIQVDGMDYTSCRTSICATAVDYANAGTHSARAYLWGRDPDCGLSTQNQCSNVVIAASSYVYMTWFAPSTTSTSSGQTTPAYSPPPSGGTGTGGTGGGGSGGTGSTGGSSGAVESSGTSVDGRWTITLSASFGEVPVGDSVQFTATVSRRLGDTGYSIRILDDSGQVLSQCVAGTTCAAAAASSSPASVSYWADLMDANGSTIVQSVPLEVRWADASTITAVQAANEASSAFPGGILLFVAVAAALVGGLLFWALRAPRRD